MTITEGLPMWQRHPYRICARARSALAIFVVAATFPSDGAFAASCENAPPAVITLEVHRSGVREDFDTTSDEIRRVAAAKGVQPHWPALGVYTSKLRYRAEISQNTQAEDGGLYCATPGSVDIIVSLESRVIHLARELGEDRCLEKGVRQHERQHSRADEQALDQGVASSTELRVRLAHLGPSRAPSAEIARASVKAAVEDRIAAFLDRLDRVRARLNQIVDAPQAIAQMRNRCGAR